MPILDSQLQMQQRIEHEVMVKINDLTDRMIRAEYALYKTETTDNRFDRIYDKLTHIEASRLKDKRCAEDQKRDIETLVSDTVFKIEN